MRSLSFLLLMASLLSCNSLSAQLLTGERLKTLYPGAMTVRLADENPLPQYVQFLPDQHFDEAAVFDWLQKYTSLDEQTSFRLIGTEADQLGGKHYRYRQYYRGVPIQAGILILHERYGKIEAINGELFAIALANTEAGVDAQEIVTMAIAQNPAELYAWETGVAHRSGPLSEYPEPQLVWVSEGLSYRSEDFKLAYEMDIYSVKPHRHRRIWLDAASGRELATAERSCNTDTPGTADTQFSGNRPITAFETDSGTFESRETGRGNGISTYDCDYTGDYSLANFFTDDDNNWTAAEGAGEGMECHFATEQYYDLLQNEFGRNSIDGDGWELISYTRYTPDFANAFWNSEFATFGSGAAGSQLDQSLASVEVVSHEFTHGLTEFTASLIYNGESGALNESFSDIFGLYLDFKVRPEAANWIMGEESTSSGTGIRSAEDPNIHGDPDTYGGDLWVDGAGVHTNSGVQNHWYQILSDGETGTNDLGDDYEVEGVGVDVAAQIAFRNLTVYLTESSNYEDAAFYAQLAATDLYGRCSSIWTSNANAWYAVGLGAPAVDELMANFSATQVHCAIPAEVHFFNLSSYSESAFWDFGDGTTSTEWSPLHTYSAAGSYDVTLVASGCEMGFDTLFQEQYILVDPEASACDTIIMPESGTTTVEVCSGVILDPGGDGNYSDNTFSTLTVVSPTGTPFELELLMAQIEGGFDDLYIYDGPNDQAPLLAMITGTNYPVPESFQTTGDSFTLVFDTDGSVVYAGYIIQFISETGTVEPIAGFDLSDTDLELNEPLFVTDQSQESVSIWYDFGDGTVLFSANPEYRYTSPGTYTITQYVSNCLGMDTTFQEVNVMPGGSVTLDKDTICVSLLSGTSIDTTLLISNGGPGNLHFDWETSTQPEWVILEPNDGLIAAGESLNYAISIHTADLIGGVYTQDVILNTGDPEALQQSVHFKLTVIGIPDIYTNPNPQDFGIVFNTVGAQQDFKIYNPGTDVLLIDSWSNSLSDYTFSASPPFSIPARDSLTITTTLSPSGLGVLNDILSMQTNAGAYDHVLTAISAPAPEVMVDPLSICVNLEEGQTTAETITISNNGGSILNYEWATSGSIVVWMHGVDVGQEGQTVLDILSAQLPDAEVIVYDGSSPDELATLLATSRVLLMPESELGSSLVFLAASAIIQDFVNSGGGLIHCAGGEGDPVGQTGVFSGFVSSTSTNGEMDILASDHPLLNNVSTPIEALNLTTGYTFDTPLRTDVLNLQPSSTALSALQYGAGRAVYVGYDYFESDENAELILANAVNWVGQSAVGGLPSWLGLDPLSGSVEEGQQGVTTLDFDATDLLAGTYSTNLILSSNDPATPEVIVEVKLIVVAVPRTDFSANPVFSCDGVVDFTDETLNTPTSWAWDFGDGNTSTEMNPTHTYAASGTYTVSLTTCNDLGCDGLERPAYIQVDLTGTFCDTLVMENNGFEEITNCTGYIVDSGGPDGDYPNNFESLVTIQPAGATEVTLFVESFRLEGCCDYLWIYDGPDINSPLIGRYNGQELVPGDFFTSSGNSLTVRFTTDFSVTYAGFLLRYECAGVPPVANFVHEADTDCTNTWSFTNQSEHGQDYHWDFGDGVTSNQEHPTHSYGTTGEYMVSLTTSNAVGTSEYELPVSITSVPFGLAINMPTMVDMNTLVDFSPSASTNLVDAIWELGDGNFFNQENVSYTFTEAGTYPIRLQGWDASGCSIVVQQDLIVNLVDDVNELGEEEYFHYYPNPNQGELFIDVSLTQSGVSELRLTNTLGQLVYQQTLGAPQQWQDKIDLSPFPAGTYFLQLRTDDGRSITGRVQKF